MLKGDMRRLTRRSLTVGVFLWTVVLATVAAGKAPFGIVEMLFLFAPLIVVPLGLCTILEATRGLQAWDIWMAIFIGHMTRCVLSVLRFRQQKWRGIHVDIGPVRPPLATAECEVPVTEPHIPMREPANPS